MANKSPANPRSVINWTPRKLARFRQLAAAGKSARVIADAILTQAERDGCDDGGRNAIIGKAHREKIKLSPKPSGTPPAPRAKGPSKPRGIA